MKKTNIIISLILSLMLTLSITWNSFKEISKTKLIVLFIILLISIFLINFIITRLDKENKQDNNSKIQKREFIIYSILIISILGFAIISFYPGLMCYDTTLQWEQIKTGIYSNWHPVFHTLYIFKLPTLFYNGVISSTIFQSLNIYLILLYFCYTMRKNFLNFKQTVFILLLIILNPIFIEFSMQLWKDTIYSWFLFLEILVLINMIVDKDTFFKNNKNKFLLIFGSLGILLFRHNGLVAFVLTFITLIICYKDARKFLTISFASITASYFIITGPVYRVLDISGNGGKTEMAGVIMSNISYYYNNYSSYFIFI